MLVGVHEVLALVAVHRDAAARPVGGDVSGRPQGESAQASLRSSPCPVGESRSQIDSTLRGRFDGRVTLLGQPTGDGLYCALGSMGTAERDFTGLAEIDSVTVLKGALHERPTPDTRHPIPLRTVRAILP